MPEHTGAAANPALACACRRRRCTETSARTSGELCGKTVAGQPTGYGCGQWFCLWHLRYVPAFDAGEDIRLCGRCERAWERARLAAWDRAMREMRPAGVDPRTVYAILVAICLLLPLAATWPNPSGLLITVLLALIIRRYGP